VIEPIDTVDDPRIAEYARVGDAAWLRERGLFVTEGRLLVGRLLESGTFPLRSMLLTPASLRGFGAAIETDAPVYVAEPRVLGQITGFNFHRGCVALAYRPPDEISGGRFADADLLIAVEGVGNPDNIGGLFRVAAAFDVDGVLLDPTSGDPFYRKAVRTSMGAVLHMPFERISPWPSALEGFKELDFEVVALTPALDARSLEELAGGTHGPLIVMVGAEGPGLSAAALQVADAKVRIPIAAGIDSLNVTVAAGIALSRLAVPH
jgi:tRNA G18 (ribose-2'-O)-methylase SpoU